MTQKLFKRKIKDDEKPIKSIMSERRRLRNSFRNTRNEVAFNHQVAKCKRNQKKYIDGTKKRAKSFDVDYSKRIRKHEKSEPHYQLIEQLENSYKSQSDFMKNELHQDPLYSSIYLIDEL